MDHFEQRFRALLSQMLDAELSTAEADELATLCEANPARVSILRNELELAELIRHAVKECAAAATPLSERVEAIIGEAPESGFEELLSQLLNGEIAEEGMDQLVRHCWRDEKAAHALRRALKNDDILHQSASPARSEEAFMEALETRMWAEQQEDHFVDDVVSNIVRLHPELPPAPVVKRRGGAYDGTSGFAYLGGWAAAAAAVIALTMSILFQPVPSAPMTSVAEVGRAVGDVRWANGESPIQEQYFVPGHYSLESGVVTVAFGGGADLTIEGPAEFDVRSEYEAFVHSGVALLAKHSLADGSSRKFRLRTEALDLGDSDDTIGLIADGSSSAEAVIFDGDARVCLPDLGFCREMFALEPVRADMNRQKLFDIPYNPGVFARAWEVNAGVERNTGPVRMMMPGSEPDQSGDLEIFVESTGFIADAEMEVDTLDAGRFSAVSPGGGRKLSSGGRELRSYLLQLRPDGSVAGAVAGDDPLEASVTFDHEIVGVIYSQERLAGSDSIVGADMAQLATGNMTARGLDADSETGDQILLSDDRRTVNLKLHSGGNDQVDHVRVLVALN